MTLAEFWPQCLRLLYTELSEQQFKLAIAPLTVGTENGNWVIYAKNNFSANMLRSQYADKINLVRQQINPDTPILQFKVGSGEHYAMAEAITTKPTKSAPQSQPKNSKTTKSTPQSTTTKHTTNVLEKNKKTTSRKTTLASGIKTTNLSTPEPTPSLKPTATTRKNTAQDIIARRMSNLRSQNNAATTETSPLAATKEPAKTQTIKRNNDAISRAKALEEAEKRHKQTNLSTEYTFDTLVEGNGNRLAVAIAKSITDKPGDSMYNPFFIYGSTGLGKTHLVQSIGNALLQKIPNARVRYMHSDEYLKTFMTTVRNKTWDNFKQQYLNYDLLIIDDIQFIQGKDRTMEEFFFLFEHFHTRNQQIILTCDQQPSSLANMEQRLISRFSWGMTIKLDPPELKMRVQILERKAETAGILLDEDAALFIAQHVKQNVRELEGALNRVLARCRFEKRLIIDMGIATEALQDIVESNHRPITVELIMKTVADFHQIRVSDLIGKKRSRNIARPRQMAMAITKELTNMSLPAIGSAFGGRDHTTVLHAIKAINKLCKEDEDWQQNYEKLLILVQN